jgi:TolB-like protein
MRKALVVVVLLIVAAAAFAADTVAITDLQVSSANPKFQFMGKGLAELISFELAKSKALVLIERDKRTEMMQELELSVSDLADPDKQLEVGRLLAAKYMIFGELIDMDQVVLISLRMIDVQTGGVVWRDKLDESLKRYAYIAGYFAKSILKHLNAGVAQSTEKAVAEKKDKNVEAAVALSSAIDSYDRKDTAKARKSLDRARRLDPQNKVVDLYLQKLAPTAAKYKVQLEILGPSENPAVLGVIRQDRIYLIQSMPTDMSEHEAKDVGDGFTMGEQNMSSRIGMEMPLGVRLGLAAEFAFGSFDNKVIAPFTFDYWDVTGLDYFHDRETSLGGTVGLGLRALDWLSLGAGVHLYHNTVHKELNDSSSIWDTSAQLAFALGVLARSPDNRVVVDLLATYPTQEEYFLDVVVPEVVADHLPLIFETTLTSAFLERRLFLVTKALADIYYDRRQGVVLRAIPVVEYWPWRFLSLRGGYQFTYLNIDERSDLGHGFVVGATARIGKYDVDFNFTSRYQPGRVLPGYGKQENFVLFGLSKSDTFSSLSR